jgi:glycosyltransferase involved in cell wall biosynthesis
MSFTQASLTSKFIINSLFSPKIESSPLVSVIVATFNWSAALRQTIISILHQNYKNFELLVIGDCCTDDSEQIVKSFNDPRIKWLNLESNCGSQFGPNNQGLKIAKGKYVAYVNHDDIWLKNHLSWSIYQLEKYESGLSISNCIALGPPDSNIFRITNNELDKMNGSWTPPSSVVHRLDAVETIGYWKDFRETTFPIDTEFISRFFSFSIGIIKVPTITVVKFPAAWKIDSYKLKESAQQINLNSRLARDKFYVAKQLIRFWLSRRKGNVEYNPQAPVNRKVAFKNYRESLNFNRTIRGLPEINAD